MARDRRQTASSSHGGADGFTLIEILVVLAIVAAVSAVVGPAAWRALQNAELRGAEADVQAALAALPMAAFAQGRPLVVDADALAGRVPSLPAGCRINLPNALRYAPNGMTPGGTVHLACDGTVVAFDVAAVTGEVSRAGAAR